MCRHEHWEVFVNKVAVCARGSGCVRGSAMVDGNALAGSVTCCAFGRVYAFGGVGMVNDSERSSVAHMDDADRVRAGDCVESGELCLGVSDVDIVTWLELENSGCISTRPCVGVSQRVMVGLFAELVVDETRVSCHSNGAVIDGGCVGFEAVVGAIEAEGCSKSLNDGWRNDRVSSKYNLCWGHSGASVLGSILPDAECRKLLVPIVHLTG